MPRKKKPQPPLDRTSSLNKYFLCQRCDGKFYKKIQLISHDCIRPEKKFTCKWCNVKFQSRANLSNHARNVHGDMCYSKLSRKPTAEIVKCEVCSSIFAECFQLRYHIRRTHFNLKAKLPYWQQKKVNQVWFEKVLNCNNLMEIRKAGPNTLVMRRLEETSAIKVADHDTEEIDVSHLYPTGRKYEAVICTYCNKKYGKRDLKKHIEEVHYKKAKHQCNKCHMKFKRLYIFLKHNCDRQKKPNGVRQARGSEIKIAAVESLAPGPR